MRASALAGERAGSDAAGQHGAHLHAVKKGAAFEGTLSATRFHANVPREASFTLEGR